MPDQGQPDLLQKDFLLQHYFKDMALQQRHIEKLSVRDKRATYRAMRQAEHAANRTDLFLAFIGCTAGEFGFWQLVKL
jgi:hypothetical protein